MLSGDGTDDWVPHSGVHEYAAVLAASGADPLVVNDRRDAGAPAREVSGIGVPADEGQRRLAAGLSFTGGTPVNRIDEDVDATCASGVSPLELGVDD